MKGEDEARFYRQLRNERGPNDRQRWILSIKELRVKHQCSIYEAERIALIDPIWKGWVDRQIDTDQRCAKMARSHIRYNGDDALIVARDGKLTVR